MFTNEGLARRIDAEVKRYPRAYQRRLRKFASVSPRMADLLVSFPAVAFALVSGYADADRRGAAVGKVKSGAPLSQVAQALGLPLWLRKLPPEAFIVPLEGVPHGDERFERSIVQFIPKAPEVMAGWLCWLIAANRACGSRFALWMASRRIYYRMYDASCESVLPLAAYAWFSARPREVRARELIRRPWQPSMGYRKAVEEAGTWVGRLADEARLPVRRRGPGRYSRRNAMAGLQFVVLQTAGQLADEGDVMDHCVGSYASKVATGGCIIISIRSGRQRLATMELVPRRVDPHKRYGLAQLQGPSNTRPTASVCRVVHDWLGRHAHDPFASDALACDSGVDGGVWDGLWAPYVASLGPEAVAELGDRRVSRMMRDIERLSQFN